MSRVYLANAFSLGMLSLPPGAEVGLRVQRLDIDDFAWLVYNADTTDTIDCAVGHESTVRMVESILEWNMPELGKRLPGLVAECKRKMIQLAPGDTLLVIQLAFIPEEGRVYEYEDLVDFYREGKLAFYAVHYGPC